MTYALNEVEAMAKRAARGAGMSWGMAEEASKATRWLCSNGVDGVKLLSNLLDHTAKLLSESMRPNGFVGEWVAVGNDADAPLCPLHAGAALSDCATGLKDAPIVMRNVAHPALLTPFMASVAAQLGGCVTLDSDVGTAMTDGVRLSCHAGLFSADATQVTIRLGGTLDSPHPQQTRANPDSTAWDTLTTFAHKTYAPATEASRLAGAGAGLSDND